MEGLENDLEEVVSEFLIGDVPGDSLTERGIHAHGSRHFLVELFKELNT